MQNVLSTLLRRYVYGLTQRTVFEYFLWYLNTIYD